MRFNQTACESIQVLKIKENNIGNLNKIFMENVKHYFYLVLNLLKC